MGKIFSLGDEGTSRILFWTLRLWGCAGARRVITATLYNSRMPHSECCGLTSPPVVAQWMKLAEEQVAILLLSFLCKACSTVLCTGLGSFCLHSWSTLSQLFKADFKNGLFQLISIAASILSIFSSKCFLHAKPYVFYIESQLYQH